MGTDRFIHTHVHSRYSVLDGMVSVESLVNKAAAMGQRAIALTDHGNMAGATQLYMAAKSAGIKAIPGVEAYITNSVGGEVPDYKAKRFHIGLLALDTTGYQALVGAVSLSHTRPRFSRMPRLTDADLFDLGRNAGEHIAVLTGCYFGMVQQLLAQDTSDQGYQNALDMVDRLSTVFPNLFVEIQNHSIVHDDDLTDDDFVSDLLGIASELDLPIIATQDSHYLDQHQKPAHNLMKRMVYGGAEDEFPGDSFHLASTEWIQEHYEPEVWDQVLDGCDLLYDKVNVVIPALDTYKPRVPHMTEGDSQKELEKTCKKLLRKYLEGGIRKSKHRTYQERLDYELDVIGKLGQADYLLLCLRCVNWCRSVDICIEARGSANGSLVCYLLNITQVDPVKYEVTFDRFLSVDRIKPPDVDMDIEDVNRPRLVEYLSKNFDTVQIGTWSRLGARDDDEKGSALVSYKSYLARQVMEDYEEWRKAEQERTGSKTKPRDQRREAEVKDLKATIYASVQTMSDIKHNFPEDYKPLKILADMNTVSRSYGVHAGGILLSGPGVKIKDWIPVMLVASSDTHVSMFDMDDVERWGLMKMDWLGQKSLNILKRCQELIGIENHCDFTWIPEDDTEACKLLRCGRADTGVFHQEGATKARGWKELGIKSTQDVILGTALYMPGAMNSGQKDLYIERRRNPRLRDEVVYPHPIFKKVLGPTYGTLIYQEQVINILRGLGLDMATVNMFFKIVKDSGSGSAERNAHRLAEMKQTFMDVCAKENVQDPEHSWDWLTGMAAYGFNHAHATGYGIRSYRAAYLKAHYPLEYMTALLGANVGNPKEKIYVREARHMGLRLLSAHVNVSGVDWTLDRRLKGIRRGLMSIAGVGNAVASELIRKAPFASVQDLCQRCISPVSGRDAYLADRTYTGTIEKLRASGALADLEI